MLGKKPPAAADPQFEAMALELNGRGAPYRYQDLEFPPGEWVPVSPGQAAQLNWFDWAAVRQKAAADG